ncbi:MAG: hypothetical protein KDC92_02195 [Bacteroidetes bacterium]|nr:hypothetical protein [Bacteroidota bacterium]
MSSFPIKLTKAAIDKINAYHLLLAVPNDHGLRIGVKKEGAHLKKIVGFDTKRFTDQKFLVEDITFFIDRRELKHFENVTLDFKETANHKGFVFREPKP